MSTESPLGIPEVLNEWPGPIAYVYKRTVDDIERARGGNEYAATSAMMVMKDLVEVLVVLPCIVMARDLATAKPESPAVRAFRGRLSSKPLSLGDWQSDADALAYEIAAKTNKDDLVVPDVASLFRVRAAGGKPKQTELGNQLKKLVRWRNDTIGHGPHRSIQNEILDDVWQTFADLNCAIKDGLRYRPWLGLLLCGLRSKIPLIGHVAMCAHRDCPAVGATNALPDIDEPLIVQSGTRTLELSPYASVRRCLKCHKRDVFLFNSRKPGDIPKYYFFEYVDGHTTKDERRSKDPSEWSGEIQHHIDDSGTSDDDYIAADTFKKLAASIRVDEDYVKPEYLHDWVRGFASSHERGILCLRAPAHTGKSVFSQAAQLKEAIKHAWDDPHLCTMHIRRDFNYGEARWNDFVERRFIDNTLGLVSREPLPWITHSDINPKAALLSLFRRLDKHRLGRRVLLCLDGLDELPDQGTERRNILDFIPAANELPDGYYILLTCRPAGETPRWIEQRLESLLKTADGADAEDVSVYVGGVDNPGYQAVLRKYYDTHLKEMLKPLRPTERDEIYRQVVDRAEGTFLYVAYLVGLLESNDVQASGLHSLPKGQDLFKAFLHRLSRLVGDRQMNLIERILSVLAAVEEAHNEDVRIQPAVVADTEWQGVSMDVLAELLDELWTETGGPRSWRLLFALQAIRHILRSWQGDAEMTSRYRLGLKGFLESMRQDTLWSERIDATHQRLVESFVLRWEGRFNEVSKAEPEAEYMLRYVVPHAAACKTPGVFQDVLKHDDLPDVFFEKTNESIDAGHGSDAARWRSLAIEFISLRSAAGISTQEHVIAHAYMHRAGLLHRLGDHGGAIHDYDEADSNMDKYRESMPESGLFSAENVGLWTQISPRISINRACLLSDLKDYNQALALCDHTIRYWPAFMSTVLEYLKVSQSEHTEQFCCDCIQLLADAYKTRGDIRFKLGDMPGAHEDYGAALGSLEEASKTQRILLGDAWYLSIAAVHKNRGMVQEQIGDINGANADYERALEAVAACVKDREGPPPAEVLSVYQHILAGRAELRKNQGDRVGGMTDIDKAFEISGSIFALSGNLLSPEHCLRQHSSFTTRAALRLDMGDAQGAHNDDTAAIDIMRDLVENNQYHPADWDYKLAMSYYNRSLTRVKLGDRKGSHDDLDRAIDILESVVTRMGDEMMEQPYKFENSHAASQYMEYVTGLIKMRLKSRDVVSRRVKACADMDRATKILERQILHFASLGVDVTDMHETLNKYRDLGRTILGKE